MSFRGVDRFVYYFVATAKTDRKSCALMGLLGSCENRVAEKVGLFSLSLPLLLIFLSLISFPSQQEPL